MKRLLAPVAVIVPLALVARITVGMDAVRLLTVVEPVPPLVVYLVLATLPLLALVAGTVLVPGGSDRPGVLGGRRVRRFARAVLLALVAAYAIAVGCIAPARYRADEGREALTAVLVDSGLDPRWGPLLLSLLAAVPLVLAGVFVLVVGLAARRPPEQRASALTPRVVVPLLAAGWVLAAVAVWLAHPTPMRLA